MANFAEDVDNILHPDNSAAGRLADEEWERRCERLLSEGEALEEESAEALWRCFDDKMAQIVATVQAAVGQ